MEKKIQDYFHLYLGQNVVRNYDGHPVRSVLTAENLSGFISGWEPRWHKLELRPLSSMTEEEFIEAGKIHISEGGTIRITIEELRRDGVQPMRPETFRWALSKGFDLFRLIESGLAINKTLQSHP